MTRTDEVSDILVMAPPPVPATSRRALARWLPSLVLLAGVGIVVGLSVSGPLADRGSTSLLFPVMMIGSTFATMAYGAGGGPRNSDLDRARDDYLEYLADLGGQLAEAAAVQRDRLLSAHPRAQALWTAVGTDRMWERRRDHADFGLVRFGVGAVDAATRPVLASGEQSEAFGSREDPVTAEAARQFVSIHTTVPDTPVTLDVTTPGVITVDGDDARAVARALICQLAVWHSPADITVAVVGLDDELALWEWVKWLPHNRYPASRPMFFRTLDAALAVRRTGHLVVVAERLAEGPRLPDGVTLLTIGCAGPAVWIRVAGEPVAATRPDLMSAVDALVCARRMAAHRPDGDDTGTGWLSHMGIKDITNLEPNALWSRRSHQNLRVPIGTTPVGDVVELDINEAAENGVGPHGLCIGATGSGKSELLRAIALGMIAGHSPETLNLILVDFKGGATFLDLERADHVAAVITNLADEAHLVERMHDALSGEIHRRQQVLRAAGNLTGITQYQRLRLSETGLAALPVLFVIVDEFSELLSTHPEFIDVFVAIGRLGRSLGIHLLLASQRLDEGRLRGLDSHLSYRICLKTLSPSESRAVLGVPDAFHLPAAPGAAYLQAGAAEPVQFHSAFVSGRIAGRPRVTSSARPAVFTVAPLDDEPPTAPAAGAGPQLLDAVLDALAGHGPPAHRVWLAPLDRPPTLDNVLAQTDAADLVVPIGLIDNAFAQCRTPALVDLAGSAGNVAIIGAPQSGKTTALRTFVLALAATHHPHRVQVYCLDLGGGLAALGELPHVGSVAGRRDSALVARTVTDITALARRREALFSRCGVESIAEYRRRRAGGDLGDVDDPFGDVFLVVDGWATLRHEFDGLDSAITSLAAEGLSLGIHVVVTASRWADLRPALKDQIGTRIELRLGDPADSEIDRRRARNVPPGRPGRGLTSDALPLTLALPRLDDACAAEALATRYGGRRAPAIAVLPAVVGYASMNSMTDLDPRALPLGIDEAELAPIAIDFGQQPHLMILGDSGSGKTTTLRTLCAGILRAAANGHAELIVMDPRRCLAELRDADHVAGYADTVAQLSLLVDEVVARLGRLRMDTYLVIDDYDMLTGNPLARLLDVLPHARETGFHMVIARRSAGAARALYEPVLSAVRELDAMSLQLSATTDEGLLLGATRPRPLPPGRGTLSTRGEGERLVQVAWTSAP